jgi:microcystin-dependent protein
MAASPVKAEDIDPLNPANSLCDEMLKALRLRDQMREFLDWLLTVDGNIEDNVLEGIADRLTPVGSIQMWASQSMPSTKWLLCNGQAVSRTTYASLFLRIGTVFGAGNGSTTFQLPNFTDRSPIGAGAQYTAGLEVGASTVALTEANVPLKEHYHGTGRRAGGSAIDDANNDFEIIMRTWTKDGAYHYNSLQGDGSLSGNGNFNNTGNSATTGPIADTVGTNQGTAHTNIQPSLGIYFIIKAL